MAQVVRGPALYTLLGPRNDPLTESHALGGWTPRKLRTSGLKTAKTKSTTVINGVTNRTINGPVTVDIPAPTITQEKQVVNGLAVPGCHFEGPVEAIITVVQKQRPDMHEQMVNRMDVMAEYIFDQKVTLQLVSNEIDPNTGCGKRSSVSEIKNWAAKANVRANKVQYLAEFTISRDFGEPGAILVKNKHSNEFYLDAIVLKTPLGSIYFDCLSWVHSEKNNPDERIFFSNRVFLPSETPAGLQDLRAKDMEGLRGSGTGVRKTWERIYDYAVYNDLGDPDENKDHARPILGGKGHPYPRRVRTGRHPSKTDLSAEHRLDKGGTMYVPRDESFEQIKEESFAASSLRGLIHQLVPAIVDHFNRTPDEFDSFNDIDRLYRSGIDLKKEVGPKAVGVKIERFSGQVGKLVGWPSVKVLNSFLESLPLPEVIKDLTVSTGEPSLLKYPLPEVLSKDKFAWLRDEEFARQRLAGVNPLTIKCLKAFPPRSHLDSETYGPQVSAIKPGHLDRQLEGLTVAEAVDKRRLFILDYHDIFMPFVNKINSLEGRKIYASRTIFFLSGNGVLKPVAIELSLPPVVPGAASSQQIFTPEKHGTGHWLWQLAKAHVCSNDAGCHQLASHWLRTHACMEPYVIATHRQLSQIHPVAKLLRPHLRYTLEINAAARQNLISAAGVIESNFTPGKYSMEMSSAVYSLQWRFDLEGLPADLVHRGMAVEDSSAPHGLRLLIEDYPYAADGLLLWSSIKSWVQEYLSLYYPDPQIIRDDTELQQWWTEIRTQGHADKKDEPWWPKLESKEDLVQILTTIIWVASGHHAAVNFAQYGYTGFMPNLPCLLRRLIPKAGDPEFLELISNPEIFMLGTLPSQPQATVLMAVLELLSSHSPDEEYIGCGGRHTNWTNDAKALDAFTRFSEKISEAEREIQRRNANEHLKHRHGAGVLPYELLLPTSKPGITGRGVPNSVSI